MSSPPPFKPQADVASAITCARICDSLRGVNTVILDLTAITPLFDFFVITTASNRRQMHAVADEVGKTLKGQGHKRLGLEGYDKSSWIVEDFGDIVIHLFTEDTRSLYDLDNLWGDAPRIEWQEARAAGDSPATSSHDASTSAATDLLDDENAINATTTEQPIE